MYTGPIPATGLLVWTAFYNYNKIPVNIVFLPTYAKAHGHLFMSLL